MLPILRAPRISVRPLAAAGAAAVAAVAYRTAAFAGFANDHYMHLAWAQQIVRGDWPGRDFVEPGMPLTLALSAAAQTIGGGGLWPEFLLTLAAVGVSAGLTCWLAARFTGSVPLGICAAALQVAIFPRLYNYPKLLVPLIGLWLVWTFLETPRRAWAAALGAWLAAGFLFRHDYLVYLMLAAGTAVLALLWMRGWRAAAAPGGAIAAAAAIVVLPYLLVLAVGPGIGPHVRDALEFARGEGNQWDVPLPQLRLGAGEVFPDRTQLPPSGAVRSAARAAVFSVALPLSPAVNAHNAGVMLYYAAFLLPAVLLMVLTGAAMRRRPRAPTVREAQGMVLAVLALSMAGVMVRHPIDARLPDVGGPMPIVLVGLVAILASRGRGWRTLARGATAAACLAVVLHGHVWSRLYDTGAFSGPAALAARYARVVSTLWTPPWEAYWPNGPLPQTVQYIRACTAESDRILVTWFAPEVVVFAGRGFGGGHPYLIRRSFYGLDYQDQMIARLERERVAIALTNLDHDWFDKRFHRLRRYLDARYTIVGTDRFANEPIAVAVRRDLEPRGTYAPLEWPCFR